MDRRKDTGVRDSTQCNNHTTQSVAIWRHLEPWSQMSPKCLSKFPQNGLDPKFMLWRHAQKVVSHKFERRWRQNYKELNDKEHSPILSRLETAQKWSKKIKFWASKKVDWSRGTRKSTTSEGRLSLEIELGYLMGSIAVARDRQTALPRLVLW